MHGVQNGHPIQERYTLIVGAGGNPPQPPPSMSTAGLRTLHWDGDTLLFTSDQNGVVDDIKIEDMGDVLPTSSYTGLTFSRARPLRS